MGRGQSSAKVKGAIPVCPYCGETSLLTTGDKIFRNRPDLKGKNFYRCQPCQAHVGCQVGTQIPLGGLADDSLRKARRRAHTAFDPLWKSRKMNRNEAYRWLSEQLGIGRSECHIALFDTERCDMTIRVCEDKKAAEIPRLFQPLNRCPENLRAYQKERRLWISKTQEK